MEQQSPAYEQDQLSLMLNCQDCIRQDERCTECAEDADTALSVRAYESADDTSLTEKRPWLVTTEVSGHEWVGSLVRLPNDRIREEFLEPVVHMEDRILESTLVVESNEVVCSTCHLVCWRSIKCPNCEEVTQ